MLYLSQMLGEPVIDANGEKIGSISDLAIQTGEVFPRITSLAFLGPGKTPFMISWRKYVKDVTDEGIELKSIRPASASVTFSPMKSCSRAIYSTARSSTRKA